MRTWREILLSPHTPVNSALGYKKMVNVSLISGAELNGHGMIYCTVNQMTSWMHVAIIQQRLSFHPFKLGDADHSSFFTTLPQEPWVECDECKRWVHQICGLFDSRDTLADNTIFRCPTCILKGRRKWGWSQRSRPRYLGGVNKLKPRQRWIRVVYNGASALCFFHAACYNHPFLWRWKR